MNLDNEESERAIEEDNTNFSSVADERPESYKGEEPYIFVSYSHDDETQVYEIIEQLKKHRFRVCFDEGIPSGENWIHNLANRISRCQCFCAVFSKSYWESNYCKKELEYALEEEKINLGIHIQESDVPAEVRLMRGAIQDIYMYQYNEKEKFFEQLFSTEMFKECQEKRPIDDDSRLVESIRSAFSHTPNAEDTSQWDKMNVLRGYTSGALNMGICFYNGDGKRQNFKLAAQCFEKAAEDGNVVAMSYLGICYFNGEGVEQNYEKAAELFEKAAEQGNAAAQFYLGKCYLNGYGVARNIKTAAEWTAKAAEQGYC